VRVGPFGEGVHELSRVRFAEISAELRSQQHFFQLVEQSGRDHELEFTINPAPEKLRTHTARADGGRSEDPRVEDPPHALI
jgi:hypothetical protein